MRQRSRSTIALAFLALVGSGCGPAGGRPVALFGEPEEKQLLRIQIQNNNFNDATVHALWEGGGRRRLGTVSGKGSGIFTLDWTNTRPIQLEIDFLAGGECTTRAITASPGESLQLTIGVEESSVCDATN